MRKLLWAVAFLWSIPVFAGEMVIDLDRVFYDEVVKKYGIDAAQWIMNYPTHPVVDVSGREPKIHNGSTTTWRTYDPRRAEWGCVFRVNADGEIAGLYLYDNRLKAMPVSEDSVFMIIKKDMSAKEKK